MLMVAVLLLFSLFVLFLDYVVGKELISKVSMCVPPADLLLAHLQRASV